MQTMHHSKHILRHQNWIYLNTTTKITLTVLSPQAQAHSLPLFQMPTQLHLSVLRDPQESLLQLVIAKRTRPR